MAVKYVDLELTSGSNNGTSWADAWQTPGAITGLSAGDTVLFAKSAAPTPVDEGGAVFTLGSMDVVISSSKTAYVCECVATTGWAASANVTLKTYDARRYGSASLSVAIASGFTTGVVAYYNLGSSIDYSAYNNLNFYIYVSTALAANRLEIRFYDGGDGTGSVVATYKIPALYGATWYALVLTPDSAPTLTDVESIAIYATTDPGTITAYFNCMFMSLESSEIDCIDLHTLIGPSDAEDAVFYPVGYPDIDGTTITIDMYQTGGRTANRGGVLANGDSCYRRKGFVYHASTYTTYFTIPTGGSTSVFTKYIGGVNTATDEVDGQTIVTSTMYSGNGVYVSSKDCVSVQGISLTRFGSGYYISNNCRLVNVSNISFVLASQSYSLYVTAPVRSHFENIKAVGLTDASTISSTAIESVFKDIVSLGCNATWSYGIEIIGSKTKYIGLKLYGSAAGISTSGYDIMAVNLVTDRNTAYGIRRSGGSIAIINPSIGETMEYTDGSVYSMSKMTLVHRDGVAMDIIGRYESYYWTYDNVNDLWVYAMASSEAAAAISPDTSLIPVSYPAIDVGLIPVEADLLVTVTLKVTKSHATNVSCQLLVYADYWVLESTAAQADTDTTSEQTITLTFTPDRRGVVMVQLAIDKWASGATLKIRDFDFEQATS